MSEEGAVIFSFYFPYCIFDLFSFYFYFLSFYFYFYLVLFLIAINRLMFDL